VAVVAFTVELMVTGPLGEPTGGMARRLGLGEAYAFIWSVLRWPLLGLTVVAFLVCLYRFSPNVRHGWRECLPGAVLGAALWIVAAAAFRLSAGLRGSSGVAGDDPVVNIIGQAVNAVVATVLWAYLASIAILLGGEYNAIVRARRRPPEPPGRFERPPRADVPELAEPG
jgi:membrane protein